MMSNCKEHKKDIAGITDMKALAEMIGDLHYKTLTELIKELSQKMAADSLKDYDNGRTKIGSQLRLASNHLWSVSRKINEAWQISKPFMDAEPNLKQ